jgi:hypothetical protein
VTSWSFLGFSLSFPRLTHTCGAFFTFSVVKYLGLIAVGQILRAQPKLVLEHKDIILSCIDDPDISIRQRALDILSGMVSGVMICSCFFLFFFFSS